MRHLPYYITTAAGNKYRTSHGLNSCRRAYIIDAYDRQGNQQTVLTSNIRKHSAGSLTHPAKNKPEPKESVCLACGHDGPPFQYSTEWPSCANCGAV